MIESGAMGGDVERSVDSAHAVSTPWPSIRAADQVKLNHTGIGTMAASSVICMPLGPKSADEAAGP